MSTASATVGCLHASPLSDEQHAAYGWCTGRFRTVETISIDEVANGDVDLRRFDVCWWHRAEPLAPLAHPDAYDELVAYLDEGGGLLLSLHALSAVSDLGVDPIGPDATGGEALHEPTGFLCKKVHEDHPVFADIEDLRVHTRGPGHQEFALYEAILPERGEVLASTLYGDHEQAHRNAVVSWRHGAGGVLGIGTALAFEEVIRDEHAARRARLAENALTTLATDVDALSNRPATGRELAELRERTDPDPHRPRYHLSPPGNWLNDPNGLIQWDGRYHVFYQYNPAGPYHHSIHWGHAVSDDLVTWRDEPIALSPSPDGPDRDGCWSGCAIDDDGTATILYTGGRDRRQLPCLGTTGDPGLRTWEKDASNPIIEGAPDELDVLRTEHWEAEFRDHCVWRVDDQWYQVIGSGIQDVGGTALLYRSPDLRDWSYVGPLLVGDWDGAGEVWECPEVLEFGDTHLLHVSNYEDVEYFLGDLDLDRGTLDYDRRGLLDHGDFYAPQSMLDDAGRYLTWGWVPEARPESAQWDAGWSGMLSLPRHLSLDEDGLLRQRPAPELTGLRERQVIDEAGPLGPVEKRTLGVRGRAVELDLTVDLGDAEEVGLVVFETPDGDEHTVVRYTGDEIVVDRDHASLDDAPSRDRQRMPIEEPGPLDLRVFLDNSVIELFANERRCLTSRVYPTRDDADGCSLYATGGEATIESLAGYELGSAWRREADAAVEPGTEAIVDR